MGIYIVGDYGLHTSDIVVESMLLILLPSLVSPSE